MIQLAEAISAFLVTLTGTRQNISYDADNRPVFGTPATFLTTGSIQEVTQKDLQLLPEGESTEGTLIWYSVDNLLNGQDDSVLTPDQIAFNGGNYKVISKGDWTLFGYQVYLLKKLDPDL